MNWLFDLSFHLRFTGIILIVLGLSHAFFDARFGWKTETARLSLLNRQIFYVHNFFVALIVTFMAFVRVWDTRIIGANFYGTLVVSGVGLVLGRAIVLPVFRVFFAIMAG